MNNKNKGFTLIELLAVIVLLAIVGIVGANLIITRLNKAKKDTLVNNINDSVQSFAYSLVSDDTCEQYWESFEENGQTYYHLKLKDKSGNECNFNTHYDIPKEITVEVDSGDSTHHSWDSACGVEESNNSEENQINCYGVAAKEGYYRMIFYLNEAPYKNLGIKNSDLEKIRYEHGVSKNKKRIGILVKK